ncbi:MAG: peptide deformylase [SAR324 cluster bacterium]|nr:peptide deformylase [SAR324 cluster bacterium]
MSVLQVFTFPHPVLTQEAKPVARFDSELKQLADNMLETMYAEGGIGLAANQVGQLKRLIVVDLRNEDQEELAKPRPERHREPRIFVNPSLLDASGETVTEEACLSVVDFTAEVKRAQRIVVGYQTLAGEAREETLEDLAAVCLQHEMDHLAGKLFIDHLPPLKRQIVKRRLAKIAKLAKSA